MTFQGSLKAQEESYSDTISNFEFWNAIFNSNKDEIKLSKLYVVSDNELNDSMNVLLNRTDTISAQVTVTGVFFENRWEFATISNKTFLKPSILFFDQLGYLDINSCTFHENASLSSVGQFGVYLRDSEFKNSVSTQCFYTGEHGTGTFIKNCRINHKNKKTRLASYDKISITNSSFTSEVIDSPVDSAWVAIYCKIYGLYLNNDTFDIPLLFENGSVIEGEFHGVGNSISGISTENVKLPEDPFKIYMRWRQLSNKLMYPDFERIDRRNSVLRTFRLDNDSCLSNEIFFDRLKSSGYKFYGIYKEQGDIESANACYAEIKRFETRRWKYLFNQNKTFESFFRWQLNSFLSYFTDYGTNPAKAVIKSGWVILLFAIFYLFFPSDWDVSNRSQLLSKVKDLASKNREKSIIATLTFVAYSGFIHILNALTLSLNAFTTLGFGDIPTHGAARYVTIVQGFIGWFLLTIFSVSLINQVLG